MKIFGVYTLVFLAANLFAADGTLTVRVFDKTTNQPLYARVSIRGSDGAWRWGKDLAGSDLTYGGLPRIWTSGELRIGLPEGETEIIVSRPFDYLPFTSKVAVKAGQTTQIDAPLEQLVNLQKLGWHGGDIHVHVVHGEKEFKVDVPHVIPIARAEGQDWCSFAEVWTSMSERQPTPQELDVLCAKLTDERFLCDRGMEHPKDHLGHMAAFPLGVSKTYLEAVGGNNYHAFSGRLSMKDGFTHFEILRALKQLGSLAIYSHPTREYGGSKESIANIARELPFDVVAAPWCLEALDVFCDAPGYREDEKLAFYLLNKGLRFAICGFTDVCYDRKNERPGDTRTYVRLPEGAARTFPELVKAVRQRRTFATTGPLLVFTIGGCGAGEVIPAGGQALKGSVDAWMALDYGDPRKPASVGKIEILRNGVVWKTFSPETGAKKARVDFEVSEAGTAWYLAKVYGVDAKAHVAISSPIFFEEAGYKAPAAPVSKIRGAVVDASGKKLNGLARAIEYTASARKEIASAEVKDGQFTLDCPADCRVEVSAKGYVSQLKSLFLDVDTIYAERFMVIRRKDLTDDLFYEKVRERLKEIEMNFTLAIGK